MLAFLKRVFGGSSGRKAGQLPRESETHFAQFVAEVRDYAVFLLDPQGHVTTWNAGAERIKGYKRDEIVGSHFTRFYPQEVVEQGWPAEELRRAAAEGRIEDEGWRIRKDGSRFWASVVITAVGDETGEIRGFLKITRDLTARKQAEEALRQSEERFRLLVEGVLDYAIFMLDPDGRVASWNSGAERIKGYRAEEIIGQHFTRFYPQEAVDSGWPTHELTVAKAEGRFEDEGWRVRKDGSRFWANVVITALFDGAGNFRGFSKVTRDLTERKRAEENTRRLVEESTARRVAEADARVIQEHRERLQVTLASIGDGILSTDAEGRTTFLNPVAERLVGWTTEEASRRPVEDVFRIVHETTRQPVENPALRALKTGTAVELANHTVLVARDGTERPIDDCAAPIRDASGNVLGSVLVFRDITERRQAQERLRAQQEWLRVTLASIGDAVIATDTQGRVTFLNAVAEQLTGWPQAEAEGQPLDTVFAITDEETLQPVENPVDKVLRDGAIVGLGNHTVLTTRDKIERPIDDAAAPIKDTAGRLIGVVLTFRDVTEQRRAERHRDARLAATHALSQAATVDAGAIGVLKVLGEGLDWDVGFVWIVDERNASLVCRRSWHRRGVEVAEFESVSCSCIFAQGEGLPGRVWASGVPSWIPDIAHDGNFPRLASARECGLHSAVAWPIVVSNRTLGVIEFFTRRVRETDDSLVEMMGTVAGNLGQFIERRRVEEGLRQQTAIAEALNRIGSLLTETLDLKRLVQVVTDEGTRLTSAQFGAFFYNVVGEQGEAYTLYTLSGVPREAFANFPMPRNTALFGPTFRSEGIVRLADVTQDSRYGKNEPYFGMPKGHLPVRSYLAIPVVSRSGEVLGGLFFGHAEAGVFTDYHERVLLGVAGQAAIAIDNARLHQQTQATAERLSLALSAAALGDWSWDARSDIVTFSQRAADIFGIPPGPHMTWTAMQERLAKDDRELTRIAVEQAMAERVQYDVQYRVNRPDGSQVWVAALGRAVFDSSEKVQGMYGVVRDITEQHRAEAALRESEEKLRLLANTIPQLAWMARPDGYIFWYNRRWYEYTGSTLEQMEGWGWQSVHDPDMLPKVMERWQASLAGGAPLDMVFPLRGANGKFRPFLTRVNPLRSETGDILYWFGTNTDISDIRRMEAALRESEERFRQLADAMAQIVWTARPDGEIDYLNQRWTEFTGLPTTVGNEGWGQILHRDDAASAQERWQLSVQSGDPFEMELRLLDRATQEYRWHLIRTVAAIDDRGRVVRWFGTGTDIHRQKRAEESARYLAEASAALAGVVDYESTLQKVARLAVPYFADWSAVDVAEEGRLRRLAVAHQDPAKVETAHELIRDYPPDPQAPAGTYAVLRTGRPELLSDIPEDLLVRGAKDERHLGLIRSLGLRSYICVPLIVAAKTFGALTFATAESGRSYDQADLALATDLAQRAAVAIENTQLYQALKETDRRKDEFLATLAHELRNPLAPIRNSLQILKMPRVDGATVERSREMMERQVHHLVRLVDDLLDVSRVMRGKIELRKELVELASVVARAIETAQPLIDAQGHVVNVRVPPESLLIDADPIRLAQVAGNLLSNAAKYTAPGGRIWLSAERDGDTAVMRVGDTGIGIAPEMLPRIFELFVQVDHAAARSQGGLGIGLTLVKNLVEMHNGTIEAHSEGLGKGSEFVVRLPLASQGLDEDVDRLGEKTDKPPSAVHRLLVVDDNQDAANSLATLLRLQGHEVRVAYSGAAALEIAKDYDPAVVFLDIGMPGMDGYEVARRLREQLGLKDVVLAALTGWGQHEDRRRSADAGFNHHLVKPPEPQALEHVLSELGRRK